MTMTWFLVVLFQMADGSLEMKEGWGPHEQTSYEECVEGVDTLVDYLSLIGAPAIVSCIEATELQQGESI